MIEAASFSEKVTFFLGLFSGIENPKLLQNPKPYVENAESEKKRNEKG